MSVEMGMSAIRLQMPARIPRTEYSIERHWEVLRAVTGLAVDEHSDPALQRQAAQALRAAWQFDFQWGTTFGLEELGDCYTDMGHAEYESGGIDRRDARPGPFRSSAEILAFDPFERLPNKSIAQIREEADAHYARATQSAPDMVHTVGTYISVISGLIFLFGWEGLLTALGEDPAAFGAMTNRYADWMMKYYQALAQCSAPVVLLHDDMVWSSGPFVAPRWYRQFVFPNFERYLQPLKEAGKIVLFCSDGNFTPFIDDLAAVGMQGFIFEPFTSLEMIVERYGQSHVIIGNADTRVLLSGSRDEIRREVTRCMSLGRGCPGYFMAVGNHIPANTPVGNVLFYNQVYEELCWRR